MITKPNSLLPAGMTSGLESAWAMKIHNRQPEAGPRYWPPSASIPNWQLCPFLFAVGQFFQSSRWFKAPRNRPRGHSLRVFPGPKCAGEIYQDDGSTFGYKNSKFLRMKSTCENAQSGGGLTIHVGNHEGQYPAWWKEVALEIQWPHEQAASVTVGATEIPFKYLDQKLAITVPDAGTGIEITVHP
jgi:alpha-glucosidase